MLFGRQDEQVVGTISLLSQFATCGPFREPAGALYREAFWLVSDHLGTPRMIVDKSGTLASVKRHDYLPFGEEIGGAQVSLVGGRTTTQGYTGDSTRQHFTGYEADGETGLNFAEARYQSNLQGRFTSVDPLGASASIVNPQSFNRYSYVNNNPINIIDPSGMVPYGAERGWADVSGGFWPTGFDIGASHFAGREIISTAERRRDSAVQARIDGKLAQHYLNNGATEPQSAYLLTIQTLVSMKLALIFGATRLPILSITTKVLLNTHNSPLGVFRFSTRQWRTP